MATTNRADIFAKSYRVLKKHYSPILPPERSVMEHWLFGCCLENNAYDKAKAAFERIISAGFDLNEVRVTTVAELAEQMGKVPDPRLSAANVKRVLQNVFESQYSFDLEHLTKQNLGKTIKLLSTFSGATQFNVSYLVQHALGGHSIPIDSGALEVMFIIGAINEKEKEKRAVPGLERAIPKKNGLEYASLLHQLAADLVASPFSPDVRKILLEIAPDAQPRLPKRRKKKKAPVPKPEKTKAAKKQAPGKAETTTALAKKKKAADRKKARPQKKKAAKKPTANKPAKRKPTKKKKKSATKQLSKRKPR